MDFPMDFVGGNEPPLSYDEVLEILEAKILSSVNSDKSITKSVKE